MQKIIRFAVLTASAVTAFTFTSTFTSQAATTSPAGNAPSKALPEGENNLYSPYADLCLNVRNGSKNPSTPTEIWFCLKSGSEEWVFEPDGDLYNPSSGLCLNVKDGSTKLGAPTEVYYCIPGAASEKWQPRDGELFNPQSGRCLNIRNGSKEPSTITEIYYCDKSPQWLPFKFPG
jgi:hypothetical protein